MVRFQSANFGRILAGVHAKADPAEYPLHLFGVQTSQTAKLLDSNNYS